MQCRFWVAHTFYNLQLAGHRMLDEQKILADVHDKRAHGIPSEAHYHFKEAACNERCVK